MRYFKHLPFALFLLYSLNLHAQTPSQYNGTDNSNLLAEITRSINAIPAATGQLLGGSGTAGVASGITVNTGLNLSGGNLNVAYGTTAGTAVQGNTIGTSGATLGLLNTNKTDSGANIYTGSITMGTASTAANTRILGAAGQTRGIYWGSGSTQRWLLQNDSTAESGNNTGSLFALGTYSDTGAYLGNLFSASRASGPLGTGKAYFNFFAPFSQSVPRAIAPDGVYGNDEEWGNTADQQPTVTLGANPLSTTSGLTSVTVNWPNCCGAGGPISITRQTWVNLLNATAVGGITPTGWLQAKTIVDSNNFTVAWTSAASSSASGGGASVTVQPSSTSAGGKFFATVTNGSAGFTVGKTRIFVANPSFLPLQSSGVGTSQYEQDWAVLYGPNDTTQTHAYTVIGEERDYINRGSDEGYAPNLYTAYRPTIGHWDGPEKAIASYVQGGGTATNWNTVYSCFSQNGVTAIYDCNSVQPNALVGAQIDPTGHGGVGYDFFGSYSSTGSAPFSTTNGSNIVTVSGVKGASVQANGNTVYIPITQTVNGVTIAAGSYAMSNVNTVAGTFTIVGSGSASATGTGGAASIFNFANLVPFAPIQFWGEWSHGITTTSFKSDDGSIISTQPGNGVQWNDGTGTASITGTEVTAGNVSVDLTAAGTAPINLKSQTIALSGIQLAISTVASLPTCNTGIKGTMRAVSDATSPTYNGTLTGGGAVSVPVYCNGSAWTSN